MSTPSPDASCAPAISERRQSLWRGLLHTGEGRIGVSLGLFMFAVIVLGRFLAPDTTYNAGAPGSGSSAAHWFGTDALGRDIFSRVIVAARFDLGMAVLAVALSFVIGLAFGALAGYFGRWIDRVLGRVADAITAFPLFVLAMGIVVALGNGVSDMLVALVVIDLPFHYRLARSEVHARRHLGYVEAARLGGNSALDVLWSHIVPNVLPAMGVQAVLRLGGALFNIAGLSFIGLGVHAPAPEWGLMASEGASHIASGAWWSVVFPGLALVLAAASFNVLGDGLRAGLYPQRRA